MNLDAEQRAYLRALLLKEQERLVSTKRFTLFGDYKTRVYAQADLVDRILSQLEVDE